MMVKNRSQLTCTGNWAPYIGMLMGGVKVEGRGVAYERSIKSGIAWGEGTVTMGTGACTCVGICPGRVESASQIELTTFRTTVLCELTRGSHSVLSPSCVAEDSRPGEGFQTCPRLQVWEGEGT